MIIFEILCHTICNIICSDNKIEVKDDKIIIVYDRHFFDYKFTNFTNQTGINLSDHFIRRREKNLFVCDSFFPSLFFIDLNIGELKKLNEKVSFMFKCFTDKNDVLFDFKIDYNLRKIMLSEFHGFGKEILSLKRYKNQKYDVFILSSKITNFVAIKNSLDYLEKIDSIRPFFSKILMLKDVCFDPKLYSALNKIYNSKQLDPSFLLRMKVAKIGIIDMINSFFTIYSFLFMPSARKFEFYRFFDYCEKKLKRIFAGSVNFINSARNEIENSNTIDQALKTDLLKLLDIIISAIHDKFEIIKSNEHSIPHSKIKKELESIDNFVVRVLEKKVSNTQITLDCDIKNIDKFVDLFFSILTEYCEILESEEASNIYAYYLLEVNVVNANCKSKYNIHYDKLIAIKINEYLRKYEHDKTDFLIFTETNYFKFKLASTIENILNFFYLWLDSKKNKNVKIQGNKKGLSEIDSKLMRRTCNLMEKWENVFKVIGELKTLTFANVLEKLSKEHKLNKLNISNANMFERDFNKKVYNRISPFTYDILLLSFGINDNHFVYKGISKKFFEPYYDPVDFFVYNKRKKLLDVYEEDPVNYKKMKRSIWDREGICVYDKTQRFADVKDKVFVNDKKRKNLINDLENPQFSDYPIKKSIWDNTRGPVNYNKRNKLTVDNDRTLEYVKERKLTNSDECVPVNDPEIKECSLANDNKRKTFTEENGEEKEKNKKRKKTLVDDEEKQMKYNDEMFVHGKEKVLKEDNGEVQYKNNEEVCKNYDEPIRLDNNDNEEGNLTGVNEEAKLDSYEDVSENDEEINFTAVNERNQSDSYDDVLTDQNVRANDNNQEQSKACKDNNLTDDNFEITDKMKLPVNYNIVMPVDDKKKRLEDNNNKMQNEKNNGVDVCCKESLENNLQETQFELLKEKSKKFNEEVILDDTRREISIVPNEKVTVSDEQTQIIADNKKSILVENKRKILFNYKKRNNFDRSKKKIIFLRKKKFIDQKIQMIIDYEKYFYRNETSVDYGMINYQEMKVCYEEVKTVDNIEMILNQTKFNYLGYNEMIVVDDQVNYKDDEKMIMDDEQVDFVYEEDKMVKNINEQYLLDYEKEKPVVKNFSSLVNNNEKIFSDYEFNLLHEDKHTGNFIKHNLIDEECQYVFVKKENFENYKEENSVVDNVVNLADDYKFLQLQKDKESVENEINYSNQYEQIAVVNEVCFLYEHEKVVNDSEASLVDKNDQILLDEVEQSIIVKIENCLYKETDDDVDNVNITLVKEKQSVNRTEQNYAEALEQGVDNRLEEFVVDYEAERVIVDEQSVVVDNLISESNNEQVFVDDKASFLNEVKSLSFDIKLYSAYDDTHSLNNSYRKSSREIELLLIDNPTEEIRHVMDTNEQDSQQELENFAFETELENFTIDFEVSFADETEQSENHNEQFFLHKVEIFVVDNIVNLSRKYNHSALDDNKAKLLHKNNLYTFDNESNFLHEDEQYECDNNETNYLYQIRKFKSKNEINGVISLLNSKENQSLNNSKGIFGVVDKHFVVNNQVISSNKNEQLLFDNKVYHIHVPERSLDDYGISSSDNNHHVNYITRNSLGGDKKIAFDDKKSQNLKYKKINKFISFGVNENPADYNYTDSVCYNKEIKALSVRDKNNFCYKNKTCGNFNDEKITFYKKEVLKNHKNK